MMELYSGIDILEISRMEKSLAHPNFAVRVFGARELAQYQNPPPSSSLAAAFCAKEAFAKAMGTGIRGFSLAEVELLHDSLGKPYLTFSGRAKELVKIRGLRFNVSLSHTSKLAIACVIAWKDS